MSRDAERLLEKARQVEMSSDQKEEQRRSFAFGNANIENANVTRETVDRAAASIQAKDSGR
jgi:hypothetical protein